MTKRKRKRTFWQCDCGQKASYRLRLTLLRSDLETEIHTVLYLCADCCQLEQYLTRQSGRKPPRATRLG